MIRNIFLLICGILLICSVVDAGWNRSRWNSDRWGNQEWNVGKWGQSSAVVPFEAFNVSDGGGGFEPFNVSDGEGSFEVFNVKS